MPDPVTAGVVATGLTAGEGIAIAGGLQAIGGVAGAMGQEDPESELQEQQARTVKQQREATYLYPNISPEVKSGVAKRPIAARGLSTAVIAGQFAKGLADTGSIEGGIENISDDAKYAFFQPTDLAQAQQNQLAQMDAQRKKTNIAKLMIMPYTASLLL
ncbi:MAG: hypothetical protein GY853_13375 [PVC group bacterium]|nr:hypothetical protein [PVC group bacterium]